MACLNLLQAESFTCTLCVIARDYGRVAEIKSLRLGNNEDSLTVHTVELPRTNYPFLVSIRRAI